MDPQGIIDKSTGVAIEKGSQNLRIIVQNLHEFLHINHNQNADITLLEAYITISVTFSVVIFEDILLLLQNLLTDWDERPRTPGTLFFETLLACL